MGKPVAARRVSVDTAVGCAFDIHNPVRPEFVSEAGVGKPAPARIDLAGCVGVFVAEIPAVPIGRGLLVGIGGTTGKFNREGVGGGSSPADVTGSKGGLGLESS